MSYLAKKNPRLKGYKSQVYNGRKYHSRAEAAYAQELDEMLEKGEIMSWTPQFRVDLKANGIHICTMLPDFYVVMADGSKEIHEIKGFETEIFRLKRKIFEATWLVDNPDVTYRVLRV